MESMYLDGLEVYSLLLENNDYLLGEDKIPVSYFGSVGEEGVICLELTTSTGEIGLLTTSLLWKEDDFIEKQGNTLMMPVYKKKIVKL